MSTEYSEKKDMIHLLHKYRIELWYIYRLILHHSYKAYYLSI